MKICVVQPDLSRIGGSISTIISFADCFKQLGYEVNVKSSFGGRFPKKLIKSEHEVLSHYGCKFLEQSDITWDFVRRSSVDTDADLCFTRGFDSRQTFRKYKSIMWVVIPNELHNHPNIQQIWTNSNTTRNKFGDLKQKTSIVVPPHDYSVFRNNCVNSKEYDIVSILRGNDFKLKGIQTYANTIKQLGLKSLLITTTTTDNDLKRIRNLKIPFVLNQTKEQVAEILGKSKIFFFPSYYESCPLVIYEALNSGCTVVSRNVGAAQEQLNNSGYIFNNDREIISRVKQALDNPIDEQQCINRGLKFDRVNQIDNVDKRLKEIM